MSESRSAARSSSDNAQQAFPARGLSRRGSELHDFLYNEHRSRDERLKKKVNTGACGFCPCEEFRRMVHWLPVFVPPKDEVDVRYTRGSG